MRTFDWKSDPKLRRGTLTNHLVYGAVVSLLMLAVWGAGMLISDHGLLKAALILGASLAGFTMASWLAADAEEHGQ